MIEFNESFDDNSILPFFVQPQNDSSRGKTKFYHNLIVNLFEKAISPCKQEFSEVQIKRQICDHYLNIYVLSHHIMVFSQPKSHHQN